MKPYWNRAICVALAATVVSFGASATLADFVVADGTFNDSDWTAVKFYDSTPGSSATFTASQTPNGGNPGAFRETTHTYAFGGIEVGHFMNGAVYNPSVRGAISGVDYSFDARVFESGASLAVVMGVVLQQNGEYYVNSVTATQNEWTSFVVQQLHAVDFVATNGIDHPDFSASGGLIQIGYVTSNGTVGGLTSTDSGIDNLVVDFHAAPEPSSIILGLLGVASLLVVRGFRWHRS